jgi:hypothetical protein
MKKFLVLIITAFTVSYGHAQKLNQDTLAKYSKKAEQLKVFSRIGADIHLNAAQSAKFNEVSVVYADKAISIVKNTKASRCDKMGMLKKTLQEYSAKIKQVITPEQFAMLKDEREKYHFGRRFVTFND